MTGDLGGEERGRGAAIPPVCPRPRVWMHVWEDWTQDMERCRRHVRSSVSAVVSLISA